MNALWHALLTAALLAGSSVCCAQDIKSDPDKTALQQAASAKSVRSASCETGIFRKDKDTFVALTKAYRGFSYTFNDGITGNTEDANALVECKQHAILFGTKTIWPREEIVEKNTTFESDGILLAGRLMSPPRTGKHTPLVIYAHGSEDTGWIDRARDPYQMVGRGVSVFVYDKRGTGLSKGKYTQNFPLLADDLVAASREAKRLADGHYGRFGLYGLSQGGWIAPLAAGRAKAEFIGIGYGLAADIAEQDAAQVSKELRDRGYGDDVLTEARKITDVTARLVKSGYKDGLDELRAVQNEFGKEPWFHVIKGGYTGVILSMSADDLRKNGIPRFDNLGVDWSQNPMQVLEKIDVPQLWALGGEDRQAPIAATVGRLANLRKEGKEISIYVFPDTDHGMYNYAQAADFSRKHTRITAGFYDLMADWAKGTIGQKYGNAQRE